MLSTLVSFTTSRSRATVSNRSFVVPTPGGAINHSYAPPRFERRRQRHGPLPCWSRVDRCVEGITFSGLALKHSKSDCTYFLERPYIRFAPPTSL